MSTPDETQEQFLDLPPKFRSIAQQHGREMFALYINTKLIKQIAEQLSLGVEKSPRTVKALRLFCKSYNELSHEYAEKQGWTQEQIAHCERDMQLVLEGRLVVLEGGKILLDS